MSAPPPEEIFPPWINVDCVNYSRRRKLDAKFRQSNKSKHPEAFSRLDGNAISNVEKTGKKMESK